MRWLILLTRVAALTMLGWALITRADCAFVEPTCLGTNLFSYFTIHSNLMLLVMLLVAMPYGLLGGLEPLWLTAGRALVTTYMVVTGVTFAVMVANAQMFNHLFVVPPSSMFLHFVLPPYAVLDFVLAPGRRRLPWALVWVSLAYPVLWGAYTLIRGRMVEWYPYSFLNPDAVGGYDVVAVYASALSLFILFVAFSAAAATHLPRAAGELLDPTHRGARRRSKTCEVAQQ